MERCVRNLRDAVGHGARSFGGRWSDRTCGWRGLEMDTSHADTSRPQSGKATAFGTVHLINSNRISEKQ